MQGTAGSQAPAHPREATSWYLGASEDDWFVQVFQHEGQHGGPRGHGVGAVDNHKALVLLIVPLQERCAQGNPQAGAWAATEPSADEGARAPCLEPRAL